MGRKNSASISEHSEQEQQLTLEQQVELKIKQLPTLSEKVHAIAINNYIIEKRKLDDQLGSQISKIQLQFRKRFTPYLDQINNIINGTHTYTDVDFENQQILTGEQHALKHNYYKNQQFSQYWFKALISSDVIGDQVRQIDQPLIKYLRRIDAVRQSEKNLKITFTFAENQWFTNTTLVKQFEIQGDQIKRSFGTQINWKQGKNITVKVVKKKGKNKKKTTQKQVQSFFNFFKQIDLTSDQEEQKQQEDNQEEEDDQIAKLQRQYQIANELYENLCPKSLEYFLGVVGAGDFGDFEGLDAIGEEEQDQNEEDKPKKNKSKSKKRKGSNASSGKQ